jgi:hypothetical protein
VCLQVTFAVPDGQKKYVYLSWHFRGQIYTPDQLEVVLAQLGKPRPSLLGDDPDTGRHDNSRPRSSLKGRREPALDSRREHRGGSHTRKLPRQGQRQAHKLHHLSARMGAL